MKLETGHYEVKNWYRNIGPATTPETVSVETVDRQLEGLLDQGWTIVTAQAIAKGPESFAVFYLLTRFVADGVEY